MSVTPSNTFLNWSLCTFVYGTGPTTVTISGILDVDPDITENLEAIMGDALQFPKAQLTVGASRSITITTYDIAKCLAIPRKTPGTLTLVLNDGQNQNTTGGGAIQIVLSNAIRQAVDFKSPNLKAGSGTVKFVAYATSDADPLAVTNV